MKPKTIKEIKTRQTQRTVYYQKCEECGKEIQGNSKATVEQNMKVHVLTQHNDKEKKE